MHTKQKKLLALDQDFIVELTPKLLLQTMNYYGLKAEDINGSYAFNTLLFEAQIKALAFNQNIATSPALLQHALSVVSQWPQRLTWQQFNQLINGLLASWLDDYASTTPLEYAFTLARCLTIESPAPKSSPNGVLHLKFQSLLIHLLAYVTNQFDQYQYQYSQNFDLKTKLPNQRRLMNMLQSRFELKHEPMQLGLILLNLNINYHEKSQLSAVSAKITRAAINTIQQLLNDNAMLFHVGPSEFAILVEQLKFPAQINIIASQLVHAFEFALPLENITLIIKPCLGGASTFNAMPNAMSLMGSAKLALHHAIVNHHQIEIYDPLINPSFEKIHQLEEAVMTALHQNELVLLIQPVISLPKTDAGQSICTSAELLLRLQNGDWPEIPPAELIDIIYKKGFGKKFIRWLINYACQLNAELNELHQQDITLNINLCASDLLDTDLPELIAQAIQLWHIPAKNLLIEITESDLLIDEVITTIVIGKIAALGCKLALDDFGTGYSSMSRLRNMPIDVVKIDQSFVRNITFSMQDREIVASIIQLSHSLGKEVVAEGVENDSTLNILKKMKCEKIQGYHYAKPMSYNEFNIWLKSFNHNPP